MGQGSIIDPGNRPRWLEASNAHSAIIPAYSCVLITGATYPDAGSTLYSVTRPTGSDNGRYAIVGPAAMPYGGHGIITCEGPVIVAYDSGDGTPVVGEIWGPKSGQFTLDKGKPGYVVVGGVDTVNGRCLVRPMPVGGLTRICFSLDAAIAVTDASKSATVEKVAGNPIVATSATVTVYNTPGNLTTYLFAGDSGNFGWATYVESEDKFYIDQLECPS